MPGWTRSEQGQTAAEYMGALLVVSVIVAAVATTSVGATVRAAMSAQVECIGAGRTGCASSDQAPPGRDVEAPAEAAEPPDFYDEFITAGPRGRLLAVLNGPDAEAFEELVDRRDMYLDGGETSRRFFTIGREPGRGVVAFDFFIPSENSDGFRGDGRPEEGTDVLRSDLGVDESRVMIVIDFETGRGVIVQSETHADGPWGLGGANEPRPISLNGDRGAFDNEGGIDVDGTNQIDLESDTTGMHVDWDILNSVTPFIFSVDGDVDFEVGDDGFLHSDDFGNQDRVDRYPQIQVWQYLPDGRSREIARNDYQGGHNPVLGAMPHCNLPNGPDLPAIGIGGVNIWDMPDLPDGPTVPGPC